MPRLPSLVHSGRDRVQPALPKLARLFVKVGQCGSRRLLLARTTTTCCGFTPMNTSNALRLTLVGEVLVGRASAPRAPFAAVVCSDDVPCYSHLFSVGGRQVHQLLLHHPQTRFPPCRRRDFRLCHGTSKPVPCCPMGQSFLASAAVRVDAG